MCKARSEVSCFFVSNDLQAVVKMFIAFDFCDGGGGKMTNAACRRYNFVPDEYYQNPTPDSSSSPKNYLSLNFSGSNSSFSKPGIFRYHPRVLRFDS